LSPHVEDARVAHLATVDPTGRPHVVPVCFALDGDTL
jgi:nitroimidazol reductase NimA-like FMN-containing flavoprotein (pyridoxamine 5'-phosphate oxidase superfamily)